MKPRVITLQETLHPGSLKYTTSYHQNRWDDEFRKIARSINMRNMAEYRVSAKCTDNLANVNAEIEVQIFKKTLLTI
jgi:histone H3/H4